MKQLTALTALFIACLGDSSAANAALRTEPPPPETDHFETPPPPLTPVAEGDVIWGEMFERYARGFRKIEKSSSSVDGADSTIWAGMRSLPVCFLTPSYLEGQALVAHKRRQSIIVTVASRWNAVEASIKLEFGPPAAPQSCDDVPAAPIRVGLNGNGQNWSRYGREALTERGPDGETLGLSNASVDSVGGDGEGVILHEFGHALGLIHEHQRPAPNGCTQDYKPGMIQYYVDTYHWLPEEAAAQLNPRRDTPGNARRPFQPQSIMMYQLPWVFLGADRCKIRERATQLHEDDMSTLRAAYSRSRR